ncbi:MAG TPA: OmpA family protein [Pseudolysinimonas sp.]|nr:OmpA family protein [Pseudolysinimonas sp.]
MLRARMVIVIVTSLVLGGTLAGVSVLESRNFASKLATLSHDDLVDADPATPAPSPETDFSFTALGQADVLFAPDSTALTRQASRQLIIVAGVLADNPEWRVRIVGHVAVVVGGPEQAFAVSTARAQAVSDELERLGIDRRRLSVVGVGPNAPVADSSTPEGAIDNRRVTLELKKGA